ncbi:FAD-binding oxidoreductase [Halorubraceae archaeon YAN]|nr:FAD-binding oxidoreductase [Halorubraceae archaeon YAN]
MRVVVIGGGIIGLASAYYLKKQGVDTVLCEQSTLGSGSTDRANGGIRTQFSSPVSVALSQQSIQTWKTFTDEFDTDIHYRRPGYLFLARKKETAAQLEENVRQQNQLGVNSAVVHQDKIQEICPGIDSNLYTAGTYYENDGFADPHLALQGYSIAANEIGVDIQTKTPVTKILQEDGAVTGVRTTDTTIECDYVVNASGAWAKKIAAMVGVTLEITPKRRQLMIVQPEQKVEDTTPFTIDLDKSVHFRPERNGNAVVGGHLSETDREVEPSRLKSKMDFDWAIETLEAVSECTSYFGLDSQIQNGWAGLYAVTPDHHPIIEEITPGFITVAGFSGHGFMQAPATGQVVADLVVHGSAKTVDVSMLTADRFLEGSTLTEGTVID